MSSSEGSNNDEPQPKRRYKSFCDPKLKASISLRTLRRQTQRKQSCRDGSYISLESDSEVPLNEFKENTDESHLLGEHLDFEEQASLSESSHESMQNNSSQGINSSHQSEALNDEVSYPTDCESSLSIDLHEPGRKGLVEPEEHQSEDPGKICSDDEQSDDISHSSDDESSSVASNVSPNPRQTVPVGEKEEEWCNASMSPARQACEGVTVDDLLTDSDIDEPDVESSNAKENNDTDPEINPPILFNNIVEEFEKEINTNFCVSKGELLLMALTAHQQNRWTNKSFVDVLNLFNFSLQNPILPGTQHILDKYLFNEEAAGITKHFFCYVCSKDFGPLINVTEVVCGNTKCKALNVATDPKKWRYFVSFDVLPQLQGLFNKPGVMEKLVNPRDIINQTSDNVIRDVYDGAMYKKFVKKFCLSSNIRYLSFTFNTDGAALYTSSNGSIWLVFLMVNELPPVLRMQNLIIAQVWFGTDHPPMDLFLGPLVKQLDKLSYGFQLKIHKNVVYFEAYVVASCVDSGARGSVQGISTFSGFFSCNWCLIPGIYLNDKVVFPVMDPEVELRSHEQLFNDSVRAVSTRIPSSLPAIEKATLTNGVRSMCEFFHLESKSLDCVFGFVVDALHALDHGIARQCMKIWCDSDGENENYFIGPAQELILDSYIDMLKPPVEVRKYPRKVSDRTNWTGREYANWVLLFSIPMLKGILPRQRFESWCWFVQAILILSRKEITSANIDIAEKLLKRFLDDFQYFYSLENMSFNCHLVSHACLTVRNWGPLWAISSAYAFEAGNGVVKKLLHSAHGVPNQVCRNLSHRICRSLLEDNFSTNQTKSYDVSIQPKKPMKRCTSVGSTHFLKTPLPFGL